MTVISNLQCCLESLQNLISKVLAELDYQTKSTSSNSDFATKPRIKGSKVSEDQEIEQLRSHWFGQYGELKSSIYGCSGFIWEKPEVHVQAKRILEGTEIGSINALLREFISLCKTSSVPRNKSDPKLANKKTPKKPKQNEFLNLMGEEVEDEILISSDEKIDEESASEPSLNYNSLEDPQLRHPRHYLDRATSQAGTDLPSNLKKQFSVIKEETEESICEGSAFEMKISPKQDIASVFKKNLKPGYQVKKHLTESSTQLKNGKLETDSEDDKELDESMTIRKPGVKQLEVHNHEKPYSTKSIPSGSNMSPIDSSTQYTPDSVFGSAQGKLMSTSEEPTLIQTATKLQQRLEEHVSKTNDLLSSNKREVMMQQPFDVAKKLQKNQINCEVQDSLKVPEYLETFSQQTDNLTSIRISMSRPRQVDRVNKAQDRASFTMVRSLTECENNANERSSKSVPRRIGSSEDHQDKQQQSAPRRTFSFHHRTPGIKSRTDISTPNTRQGELDPDVSRTSKTRLSSAEQKSFNGFVMRDTPQITHFTQDMGRPLNRSGSPSLIIKRRMAEPKKSRVGYHVHDTPNKSTQESLDYSSESKGSRRRIARPQSQIYQSQLRTSDLSTQGGVKGILESLTSTIHVKNSSGIPNERIGYSTFTEGWGKKKYSSGESASYPEMSRQSHEPIISAKVIYENLVNFKNNKESGEGEEGCGTSRGLFQKTKRSSRQHPLNDRTTQK
jgi:hypothetical protein